MKVLVSTRDTQGLRHSDFCYVPNGELVVPATMCDSDNLVDGVCGCRRSMIGIYCSKATTTVKVVESMVTEAELVEAIVHKVGSSAERVTRDITEAIKPYDVGTVLECRNGELRPR